MPNLNIACSSRASTLRPSIKHRPFAPLPPLSCVACCRYSRLPTLGWSSWVALGPGAEHPIFDFCDEQSVMVRVSTPPLSHAVLVVLHVRAPSLNHTLRPRPSARDRDGQWLTCAISRCSTRQHITLHVLRRPLRMRTSRLACTTMATAHSTSMTGES